ncbi:shufflon system plasmid conjugative transfer pilus tip adhesin PilV [Pantoea sp. EA-12]|uniref:shufflon system plasmid conjugative transfer pilus tip adhesin PilV n=4 Tax=Enterobacterales TaxID=91347 RepID=UPI0024B52C40|nr:shufflon system plasmid conjugative transfer pilus tip adhesin PilV [Pantoea sp. EA-12]MDI9223684.1 shufflon system plasmid conjugative transfer pilus tip adhesin PilV [Pantoea sp. EA-12]
MKRGIAQITDATVAYGVVAAIVVTLLIPLALWAAEEYRMNVAAGQAMTVQKAVNRYIADQQATIAAGSSASAGYTLTVPMLITAGYLPDGYAPTNAYTATYRTLIFQPATNKFHTMTFLTGGSALSLSDARKLANHIGAEGGYIENGVAKGAMGSWQENLSAFGGYNPGDGSVVIAGFYSNGALVNDYLYRHSVAGHPELNTMGTTLNMGSNDISSAKTIGTQTLNASADVNTARLTATQSIQSNGTINANGNITSSNSIAASGNVTANGSMTANGNITAGNDVTANGTLRASHDAIIGGIIKLQQVNTAGTSCDTWGSVSRDSAGAILSCQSGVWKQTSSSPTTQIRSAAAAKTVSVDCASDEVLVGGGAGCNSGSDERLKWSQPTGNGWAAACPNTTVTAYAICAHR